MKSLFLILKILLSGAILVRGSEFPERECCEPVPHPETDGPHVGPPLIEKASVDVVDLDSEAPETIPGAY